MDFQLYDYTENNFVNERFHDLKNTWAIPSDGSMDSNEEYFNWSTDLKLALGTAKQYTVSESLPNTTPNTSADQQQLQQKKRKYFATNGDAPPRKIQAVKTLKDPLEVEPSNSSSNASLSTDKQGSADKRDGNRIAGWQVDEITENLTAELNGTLTNLTTEFASGGYNVSDALLSLPSLTVFKQEAPSPTSHDNATTKAGRSNLVVTQAATATGGGAGDFADSNNNQNSISTTLQNLLSNNYPGIQSPIENGTCIDTSQDGHRNVVTSSDLSEDSRFQYVLAAATSIATKVNEDTLTYLNQGQSYEIKLKKLGDLSNYRGRILKSVIRICFYERRLQYMEKEQMSLWQSSRPGDRIIEVDVPLSYGLCEVIQPPNQLNAVHFLWDPTKEVGVYIKVNCISTEFTPKKHGGEKGVPFRIQVETYLNGDAVSPPKRLHAAACQIKVFKLKGADRKHKQDREKIMKRPVSEQERFQPSYDCTVLNDIPNEAVVSVPLPAGVNGVTSSATGPYSPEIVSPNRQTEYVQKIDECVSTVPNPNQPALPRCSNVVTPEVPVADANRPTLTVTADSSVQQTTQWLSGNRFNMYLQTFTGFSGADMLRMSKDDLIQICGQADGIRLFNCLHSKSIAPKLTVYVCRENSNVFHAIYLSAYSSAELAQKLSALIGVGVDQVRNIYCQGPHGIHVLMNDDVIRHVKEETMFSVDIVSDSNGFVIVLKPIVK
ncbi:gemini [Carabus blaptoides fortunei]